MKQIMVADLAVRFRLVEVPEKCPKCGADFTSKEAKAIRAWEYQDQVRRGYLSDLEGSDEGFVFDNHVPEGGEDFISYVYVMCQNCDQELAVGREDDDLIQAVEDVREILWPGGDKDHVWSPDTVQEVAQRLILAGLGPSGERVQGTSRRRRRGARTWSETGVGKWLVSF
jgi:hypothetical protein